VRETGALCLPIISFSLETLTLPQSADRGGGQGATDMLVMRADGSDVRRLTDDTAEGARLRLCGNSSIVGSPYPPCRCGDLCKTVKRVAAIRPLRRPMHRSPPRKGPHLRWHRAPTGARPFCDGEPLLLGDDGDHGANQPRPEAGWREQQNAAELQSAKYGGARHRSGMERLA
jgi:hypothetical protein